jgi:hypothetical protein
MDPILTPQTCAFYDLPCGANWLVLQFEAFGNWLLELFLDAGAYLVELIPVPAFLMNITPVNIPSGVVFMLGPFALEYGIGIMVAAYTARFIVRRLPVVG